MITPMAIEEPAGGEFDSRHSTEAESLLTERIFAAPLRIRNVGLSVLSTLALLLLLRYAQELFVPLVLSVLVAYALNPFVNLLEHIRIHRTLAAALVVFGLIALVGCGSYALRRQVSDVLEGVPSAIAKLRTRIHTWQSQEAPTSPIGKLQEAAKELDKTTAEATGTPTDRGVAKVQIEQPPFRATDYLWSSSMGLLALASDGVLVMFLVFFLLASGDLFKRKLVRLIGTTLSEKKVTVETVNEINRQIEHFLLIQVLTSVAVGVCTAAGLWVFGVHQPAFWGAAAAILSSVPYLGPIFITGALTLVAFVQFDSLPMAGEIAVLPIAIFTIEGLLVKPAVMGKAARINGVAMFVGLLFWSWVWGLIGMLVAVPLMMVLKSVCDRIEGLRPIGEMLDDR